MPDLKTKQEQKSFTPTPTRFQKPKRIFARDATRTANLQVQTKLKVGSSGDRFEREAESVATTITHPNFQVGKPPIPISGASFGKIGRQVKTEEEDEKIQMSPAGVSPASNTHLLPSVESGIKTQVGGGIPLSKNSKNYFEPKFGRSLSNVRIHNNAESSKLSNSMNANAFTLGNDVFFGSGKYTPETGTGKKLLAHELTHVIQQGSGNKRISKQETEDKDSDGGIWNWIAETATDALGDTKRLLFEDPIAIGEKKAKEFEKAPKKVVAFIHECSIFHRKEIAIYTRDNLGMPITENIKVS